MRRRKLLIGLGALSAGGSAAFGTEAFTSAQAERNVDVSVAGDSSSFIAIQPLSSSNANTYVDTESDNTVELELDGDLGNGEGVAQDAITQFEDLFRVVNQGSQPTFVYFDDDSDAVTFRVTRSTDTETTGSNGQSLEGSSNSVELDVGEQVVVGLTVDTLNNDVSQGTLLDSVTLRAESKGSSNAPTQSIDQPQYVVDSNAFGDSDNDADSNKENIFPTISEAVSEAESGAVIGVRNAQDITSRITIDKPLTISGFESKPSIDVTASLSNDEAIAVESDDVTIQNLELSYDDLGRTDDTHLISGIGRSGITIRGLDITSNASYDTNAIDIRGVDLEIVNNTVTDAGIQVQHGSASSSGGSVTISGNSVTESAGGGGGILGEGITAFTLNSVGISNFSYTIEDNLVRDAGTPAIKLTDLGSNETPADVNGESNKQDQIEALLRDNDVFSARIDGSNGAQVTSGSTFSTIQSAVDNAAAGGQGDGVALVESGAFTESVTIDSDVSLRGPNAGTPGQDSARGEEATIIAPSGPAVDLAGDKAEIDGIRVEGADVSGVVNVPTTGGTVRIKNSIVRASDSASGFINGIEVVKGNGTPTDAVIEGNDIEIDASGTAGAAINVLSSNSTDHNSITVRNNELRGDIGGYRDIDSLTVENNLIAPNGDAAPGSAMDVSGVDGATFTDNTFRGDVGDFAYDDDSNSTGNANTAAATASSVLNNNDGNSGNTFEPAAETATVSDGDDVIKFTSN